MTKQEFAMLTAAMKTYFPKENLLPNREAMDLWYRLLEDLPYNLAEAALQKYVVDNKFSPSIAEIREIAATLQHGETPDWGEAWETVLRMIRKYGSYGKDKALEEMDELTRQVVQRLDYMELCMSENIAVDRGNFRMIYCQLAERKKEQNKLPPMLKQNIDGMLIVGKGLLIE